MRGLALEMQNSIALMVVVWQRPTHHFREAGAQRRLYMEATFQM